MKIPDSYVNFTIGKIQFTEKGILVERNYSESEFEPKQFSYEDIRPWLVALCQRRMKHCVSELEINLNVATYVSKEMIVWSNGHFSVSVYKQLQQFVDSGGVSSEFNCLILQQVIRELYNGTSIYPSDCDDIWYDKVRNSKITHRDIMRIVTALMLMSMNTELLSESLRQLLTR